MLEGTHNPNAIPANLDVQSASYAAAFGDAIGNALVDDSPFTQSVNDLTENALLTIATGQYVVGVPITALPDHTPLQGEPTPSLRLTPSVDTLTAVTAAAVFDGAPEGNPPLGITNTLNTGDTLTDPFGDGTLNVTFVDTFLANPPFAAGVTMNGVENVNILDLNFFSPFDSGFFGNVVGLHNVTILAGSNEFGAVTLGAFGIGQGLVDALESITINANHFFEADIAAGAFTGFEQVGVTVNGVDATVDLEVTTGATGYGQVNVHSDTGANILELDTNMATIATVTVDGTQDLDIFGDALFMDTLVLFDATAASGDITAFFGGAGDLTALGGSGNDHFTFDSGNGAITAEGNDGDDTFTFLTDATDPTTFGPEDSVDGGSGDNTLVLQADTGVLLAPGVGPNIVNIHTIEHTEVPTGVTGDISVDMARSGSATVLDLHAQDYNGHDVTVTNLLNTDTVVYSGGNVDQPIGTLTLEHSSPIGIINFTMDADHGGDQVVDELVVVNPLNLVSTGDADNNVISDVSAVDANVSISGDTHLTFGGDTFGTSYNFDGGIIDASTDTGGVETFLGFNPQTFIGGLGDDHVSLLTGSNFGLFLVQADNVDLSAGGADEVTFEASTAPDFGSLDPAANDYHHVTGFGVADDAINIDVGGIPLNYTDSGASVGAGDAAAIYDYINGTVVDIGTSGPTTEFNFIKFTAAVSSAGNDAEQVFELGMQAAGSITVEDAGDEFLMAIYDSTNQQMFLFTVQSNVSGPDGIITDASDIDVVGTVSMSFAEFQAFNGNNLHFV